MSQDDFFSAMTQAQDDGDDGAVGAGPAGAADAGGTSSGSRRSQRHRRRSPWRALATALILALVLAGVAYVGYRAVGVVRDARPTQTAVSDYTGAGTGEVVVTIPDGATGNDIGSILVDAGVVASRSAFADAYAANANASAIQAGTYTLKLEMSAANAVATLLDPTSRSDHTLTIPEGATKAQVMERLQSVGGFSESEVTAAFQDTSAIGLPAAAGGDVEGWLAPSTYDVPEDATAVDVVASMVSTTLTRLQQAGVAEADYASVLTKASIVEREVSTATYYSQVARVIENRLADTGGETKGYLQMDSTVLYGLGRTGGIPSSDEIADASNAYNTYQHAGLPPTPIGSPGTAAIEAVVSPAEGDWLYFVTVDLATGETLFASSLQEQEANTQRLSAYCQANANVCSGASASASAAASAAAPDATSPASPTSGD